MLILCAIPAILCISWCLLLLPRRNHPAWAGLAGVRYAHRGLHDAGQGVPENSLSAFRAAADRGFGAELDVHLMADGHLAVVHDSNLKRVCGREAVIEELTAEALADYPLLGSVLAVSRGRAPLIIELKVERGNAAALTDAVMAVLEGWEGTYCIESFHPGVLRRLRRRFPGVVRGQLSQNFLRRGEEGNLPLPVRFVLTYLLTTAFTRPDFIAYRYEDRGCVSLRLMRRLYGVGEAGWTVRDRGTMERLEREGVLPIFEKFVP